MVILSPTSEKRGSGGDMVADEDEKPGGRRSTVRNSEFLDELLRAAFKGTTVWVCGFIGNPNGADAAWGGAPYDPARMATVVDGWSRHNTYFSVAAVKRLDDGRFHRTKLAFDRLLVLVADDVSTDDLVGSPSYVLYTSPGKCQVGVLLQAEDADCANAELVSALMQRMAEQGMVQLDKYGNNLVRYVRLPVGQNQKPRESGHWDHMLAVWAPSVRLSLADAAAVFGIDLDDVKRELAAAPRDAGGAKALGPVEFQDEKMRRLARNILAGEGLHDSTRDLIASLIASGTQPGTVTTIVQTLMEHSHAQRARPQEWQARYRDIGRLVRDAEAKFRRGQGVTIDAATGEVLAGQPTAMFASIDELIDKIQATDYVIDQNLERNAISLHFGGSGIGKSFDMVAKICCTGTGFDWYGYKVKKGPVFVIIGEGYNGFVKRMKAWSIKTGASLKGAPIFVSRRPAQLVDPMNAEQVAAEIERMVGEHGVRPELVVIDTLARNLGDGDENAAKDIGAFISNIDLSIRARYECHVAIVHHSGHDQDRARGSSALRAAVDQEFWVQGGNGKLTITCTKMKDGEPPPPISFKIVKVPLGLDANGREMDSAVLERDGDPLDFIAVKGRGKTITARELVRYFIKKGAWPKFTVVAADLEVAESNLKEALPKLAEGSKPLLVKVERGYFPADWAIDAASLGSDIVLKNDDEARERTRRILDGDEDSDAEA